MVSSYPIPGGVIPALNLALAAIKNSHLKSRGVSTLRVMLICPGVFVREDAITSMGYEFFHFGLLVPKQRLVFLT